MGLETMPSPEPCRRQRRPLDFQNPNLMRTPDKTVYFPNSRFLPIKQGTHEADGDLRPCSTRLGSSKKNLLPDLSRKQGNEIDITDKRLKQAQKKPIGNDSVVFSQVQERVHIKPIAATGPVPPEFKPEGGQRNIQGDTVVEKKPPAARSSRIDCVSSSQLNPAGTEANFTLRRSKDPINARTLHPIRGRTKKNRVSSALISTSNVSSKEEVDRPGPKHAIEPVNKHKCQANCHGSQQQLGRRTNVEVNQGFNKTDEICKQQSQTEKVKRQRQCKRPLKAKAKMVSCPLKESLARPKKGNKQRDSTDSTIVQQPSCSIKSISSNKRPSSSAKYATVKDGNKIKLQKTGASTASTVDRGTAEASSAIMPRCENNLYLNHAQGRQQHPLTGYGEDAFAGLTSSIESTTDRDLADQNNICSTDNTLSRNGQEKSEIFGSCLTFESDLLHAELHDEDVRGSPQAFISSIFQDSICNKAATSSTLHTIGPPDTTCQRICESSLEEVEDTASSNQIKRQKQTVSYSGKSTATILKELLLALNPSARELLREEVCIGKEDAKPINFNNTGGAERTTIDYIKGPVLNYDAIKISTDADLCQDTFQDFHAYNHNKENHSQKECVDICWHLDTDSAFELPSEDVPAPVRSFSSVKEWETCEEESRKRLFKCKSFQSESSSFHSSKQPFGDIQNAWDEARQNEKSYVQQVVSSTDISLDRILSARLLYSDPLITPGLFNELEATSQHKWKWGIQHEHEENNHFYESDDEIMGCPCFAAAKSNRKLVFDCIAEALKHYMGITEHESIQVSLPVIDPPPYHLCASRVHGFMNDWRKMACRLNVDDMVEKEMNSGTGKWHDFSSEIYQISVDLERNILKDLIDELLLDLSACLQNMPLMISCKVRGPVKANKDRYFWVGL